MSLCCALLCALLKLVSWPFVVNLQEVCFSTGSLNEPRSSSHTVQLLLRCSVPFLQHLHLPGFKRSPAFCFSQLEFSQCQTFFLLQQLLLNDVSPCCSNESPALFTLESQSIVCSQLLLTSTCSWLVLIPSTFSFLFPIILEMPWSDCPDKDQNWFLMKPGGEWVWRCG